MKGNRFFAIGLILFLCVAGLWAAVEFGVPGLISAPRNGAAIYYCPMHPTYTSDRPGDCPICNMRLVKRETQRAVPSPSVPGFKGEPGTAGNGTADTVEPKAFTIDEMVKMKPGEICLLHKCKMGNCMMAMTPEFARLGKCPHCGEDLGILIKEMLPGGYAGVRLTPDKQALIGVKTAPARKITLEKTIRTVGRIAHDPELYQAEQEYVQAAGALAKAGEGNIPEVTEQAARFQDSAKTKLRLMGLSDELIEEVGRAGAPDRSLLYLEPGGTGWLYANIYEYEIPYVRPGQQIEVSVPGIVEKKFTGTIRAIDRVLDPATRSVKVRAVLANPDGLLKPEMYVNVMLRTELGEVVTVPQEAVFATGEKNIVFVAKPDGVFEPREVTLGAAAEGGREIKSGISEGETVVVSGNFLIDSESRLKGALEGMAGHTHT